MGTNRRNLLFLTLNSKSVQLLALTLALSFVNLAGAFLALAALGGIEPWTKTQFVGLFGVMEAGLGAGFLFAPNVWRMPVAEANTPDRTRIALAASTVLIPHWPAAAKLAGGLVMTAYSAAATGVGPASLGLSVEVLLIGSGFLAVTAAAARLGVARPDLDVVFISIRRPGHGKNDLPGLSLTGIIIQLLANVGVFPAVMLLSPSVLFGEEMRPSAAVLLWTAVASWLFIAAAYAAWRGRIAWRAPRAQQHEAEAELTTAG
jgi:hypothetical protein